MDPMFVSSTRDEVLRLPCMTMTVSLSVSLLLMVRVIYARVLFAFVTASATCLLPFIALRTITPKSFSSCTFSRIIPFIVYSFIMFVLPECSTLHFATLNSIIHCFAHTVHLSRSSGSCLMLTSFLLRHFCVQLGFICEREYSTLNIIFHVVNEHKEESRSEDRSLWDTI